MPTAIELLTKRIDALTTERNTLQTRYDDAENRFNMEHQRLANAQALIRKIQETVSEAFGPSERWSDFDVLDQGVAKLAADTKRMEWLSVNVLDIVDICADGYSEVCVAVGYDPTVFHKAATLREAIDKARATPKPPQSA